MVLEHRFLETAATSTERRYCEHLYVGAFAVSSQIIDRSLSNLNRQCLFTLADVGEPKAATIAGKFAQIDPSIRTNILRMKILTKKGCMDAAQDATLIINCADEPHTDMINRIVTEAGHALESPYSLWWIRWAFKLHWPYDYPRQIRMLVLLRTCTDSAT